MKTLLQRIGGHFREKQFYYACTIITLGLLALGLFRFPNAIGRLVESCRDFGLSIAYMFCEWFDIEAEITPTVNNYPDYSFLNMKTWFFSLFNQSSMPSTPSPTLPLDWDLFKEKWVAYWQAFIDTDNIMQYLYYLAYYAEIVALVLILGIPIWFGVKRLFNKYYFKEPRHPETEEEQQDETRPIKESKLLRAWHWFYFTILVRIGMWFVALFNFVKAREDLYQFWLLLVLLYFNVLTIIIEFCAYYVYFVVSFDFVNLYRQAYKLCLDLSAVLSVLGLFSWTTIVILILKRKSENLEYERMMNGEVEE